MKLTLREREIAEVLYKEPLISQEELALRFGISRSSAAVHISNLMKKGVILGKGYVFNKKASVVVVGELLLKIIISRQTDINNHIDIEYGGFSAEMSRALASYGMNTKLLAVLGSDDLGSQILKELKSQEVDISNVIKDSKFRTPRKIFLDKDLQYSENIPEEVFAKAIETREWVVLNCDWLLVEDQYQELISKKMISKEKPPALCACRFIKDEVPNYLSQYSLVVLGVENFQQLNQFSQTGLNLVQAGTQNCIITDGSSMIVQSSEQTSMDFSLPPNQSFDSRTDLHLFLAGLVYGLSCEYPIRQALRIAIANACNLEN